MAGEQQGAGVTGLERRIPKGERSGRASATHHKGGVIAAHLRALAARRAGLVERREARFPSQGPGHASRCRKLEARASLETELRAGC